MSVKKRQPSQAFYSSRNLLHLCVVAVVGCLLAYATLPQLALAAPPGASIAPHLQERFGLSEPQVRGALGALLVFVRERTPKPEFDDFAERIPQADSIMQQVKLQGIVTGPLDDLDEYEKSLASLGIGPSIASQFAPAVVEYLGAAGYSRERDILAGLIR